MNTQSSNIHPYVFLNFYFIYFSVFKSRKVKSNLRQLSNKFGYHRAAVEETFCTYN